MLFDLVIVGHKQNTVILLGYVDHVEVGLDLFCLLGLDHPVHLNNGKILLLVKLPGFELTFGVLLYYSVGSVFEFSVFHLMIEFIRVAEVGLQLQFFYRVKTEFAYLLLCPSV